MASGCYVELFVTCKAAPAVTEAVMIEAQWDGKYPSYFVVQREDTLPRMQGDDFGDLYPPIAPSWISAFLGYTVEQCSAFLKILLPDSCFDGASADYGKSHGRERDRFAVLDDTFLATGELLACSRKHNEEGEQLGSMMALRMPVVRASDMLQRRYQDQWEYEMERRTREVARAKCGGLTEENIQEIEEAEDRQNTRDDSPSPLRKVQTPREVYLELSAVRRAARRARFAALGSASIASCESDM